VVKPGRSPKERYLNLSKWFQQAPKQWYVQGYQQCAARWHAWQWRHAPPRLAQILALALTFILFAPVQAAGRQNVAVLWSNDPPLGGYQFGDFDGDGKTDLFRVVGTQWQYSPGGVAPWINLATDPTPQSELRFGDFDGAGKTDVFSRTAAGQWRYSSGGVIGWVNLAVDPLPIDALRFGDFDGDGKTDLFSVANDGRWRYSSGGTSGWIPLEFESLAVTDLRFGFFDADDKIDVFSRAVNGRWRYSSGGALPWVELAIDPAPLSELALGDFNGDDITDVFNRTGAGQWRYSPSGTGSWVDLAFDTTTTFSDLRFGDFDGDGKTDVFSLGPESRPRFSSGGVLNWANLGPDPTPTPTLTATPTGTTAPPTTPLSDLEFGDFDGDGRCDLFRTVGGQWQYSSAGLGAWQNLAFDPLPLSELRFYDFNGDGKTDVFSRTPEGQWRYSDGGVSNWINLASDPLPLVELRFGDFNGDGKTDVFSRAENGQWRYSDGGTSNWINLASDPLPLTELRFGDFNGDGKTDVFSRTPEGQWRYSDGGTSNWINLASDPLPLTELRFGDFNGDGRTDVFSRTPEGQWRYSDGGTSNWINLASDPLPLDQLRFCDFNGDGRTDVFSIGPDGRWRYSSGGESNWILLGPPDLVTATPTPTPTVTGTVVPTDCVDILINGGFETSEGWQFGDSPVPAKYTGIGPRTGSRAMQLGIPPEVPLVNSYSSIRQMVMPSYQLRTLTLRWWQWMRSEEGPNPSPTDWQDRLDVILLSPGGKTIRVVQRMRTNDPGWREATVDITEMAGKSFYIYFNVYNDGGGGRTWMLMDDVSLIACPGEGPMPDKPGWGDPGMGRPGMGPKKPGGWMPPMETPNIRPTATPTWTPTPTFTPLPTFTPTPSVTITPTLTVTPTEPITDTPEITITLEITVETPVSVSVAPLPAAAPLVADPVDGCVELLNNGEFEMGEIGWSLLPGPAAPFLLTQPTFNRSAQAMHLGLTEGDNVASISAIDQVVTLPVDATSIILSFRYFPLFESPPGPGDLQYVDIYDMLTSRFAARALGVQANDRIWLAVDHDLTGLAGQTVRLVMAVNNDGVAGRSAMVVDDVSIVACRFDNLVSPGNDAPPQDAAGLGEDVSRSIPAAQAPIVLAGREPADATTRLWLSRFAAVGVLAGVVGVIGFAALVLIGNLREPD
jgi:hypothetical protein